MTSGGTPHPSVTHLLGELEPQELPAMRQLLPRVYDELRRLAVAHLGDDRPGHTLQPTALVHEVFLRLSDVESGQIKDKTHFFRLASKVMRQVLVDHARAHGAAKRGGDSARVTLDASLWAEAPTNVDLLELDEAMTRLEQLSPRLSRLVELRFYGGLSEEEAAATLDISRTQAARDWRTARAWLATELSIKGPS